MRCSTVILAVFTLLGIREAFSHPFESKSDDKPYFKRVHERRNRLRRGEESVLSLSDTPLSMNASNAKLTWVTQKLDHFNESNTATWKMCTYIDNSVYKPGNPIFLYVNGEGTLYPEDIYYYQIAYFAQHYKGLLVGAEHRYYGQSQPTPNVTVEILENYLHVEQAIEDLAVVIRYLKSTYKGADKSKVILVGGSYAGALCSWFAQTHPELADGVWSSSAPIMAKTNFLEFKESLGQSIFNEGGQECYDGIKNAYAKAQDMFNSGKGEEMKTKMKLCPDFNVTNKYDLWNLFFYSVDDIGVTVQYSNPKTIPELCENFNNDNDALDNFVNYFIKRFSYEGFECITLNYQMAIASIESNSYEGASEWTFQLCDGFGRFQTTDSPNQPFGGMCPLDYFVQLCLDIYGPKYTAEYISSRGEYLNNKFGGLTPNVKNVFFSQGSLDPYNYLGIGLVIEGASHAQDLFLANKTIDSKEMIAAHKKIQKDMQAWIKA